MSKTPASVVLCRGVTTIDEDDTRTSFAVFALDDTTVELDAGLVNMLRVTRGHCRYENDFTPAPFPTHKG